MDFKLGQRVRWNDPAIDDYDYEERTEALDRVFLVHSVDNRHGLAYIVEEDGPTEAEVYTDDLEPLDTPRQWNFVYDEDADERSIVGIVSDGLHFLFYLVTAEENDQTETCYVYDGMTSMYEDDDVICSFQWTAENSDIFLECLNNLSNPEDYCGEASPLRFIEFKKYDN